MSVNDNGDKAGIEGHHLLSRLIRCQLIGFSVHNGDIDPLLPDVGRDQSGPDRILDRRQPRSERLVNFRPASGIDENQIHAAHEPTRSVCSTAASVRAGGVTPTADATMKGGRRLTSLYIRTM